jgi:hypothetical protein
MPAAETDAPQVDEQPSPPSPAAALSLLTQYSNEAPESWEAVVQRVEQQPYYHSPTLGMLRVLVSLVSFGLIESLFYGLRLQLVCTRLSLCFM